MKIITSIVFFFFTMMVLSQIKHPKASPTATVSQEVGFTTIKVEYSRPAVRGRKIFGDLVPYSRIWRVGANESTKVTFDFDVLISGDTLPSGTYALYAFPEKEKWQLVFHKNTSHWGDGRKNYNPKEDALRTYVVPQKTETFQENFLISFDSITHDNVILILHWENTEIRLPIRVNTEEAMEQQIHKHLADNPTAQTLYEVARYYVEQNKNYDEALMYLDKAIILGGNTYYYHRVKSLAEAALGNYKSAILSANKSLELAQKQDKDEFVRMNQKNIILWKKKLTPKK